MVVVNSLRAELNSVSPQQRLFQPQEGVVVVQQPVYAMDYATGQPYVLKPYPTQRLQPVAYPSGSVTEDLI